MNGYGTKAAFEIENAHGSPVACGAGDGIPFTEESVIDTVILAAGTGFNGRERQKFLKKGMENPSGEVRCQARYDDIKMLACALGFSHQVSSPIVVGGGYYQHFFEPDYDIATRTKDGFDDTSAGSFIRCGTLAVDKVTDIWQYAGAYISQLRVEASRSGIYLIYNVVPKSLEIDPDENSSSSTWTLPTSELLMFHDMVVYLKPRDQFTIVAGNKTYVVSDDGGSVQYNFTEGTWSGQNIAREWQEQLNDSGTLNGSYIVHYDEERRKFFIQCNIACQIQGAHGGFTAEQITGFTATTASLKQHWSQWEVEPDNYSVFSSAEQISVSGLNIVFDRELITKPDSLSPFQMAEPWSKTTNTYGSLSISRYDDSTVAKNIDGATTYEMAVVFLTGSYAWITVLPAIKFSRGDYSVGGPQIITENLNFIAQMPTYLNYADNWIFLGGYFFRLLPAITHCTASYDVCVHEGKLHVLTYEAPSTYVYRLDGMTWTQVGAVIAAAPRCIISHKGSLYLGHSNNNIYKYSAGSWGSVRAMGDDCMHMINWNDRLYALDNDGDVEYSDDEGATWNSVRTGTASQSWMMCSYGANLYMTAEETNGKVFQYDGTSWTTSLDFGAPGDYMSLCVHRGKLYAILDTAIQVFDGTSWTSLTALGAQSRNIASFKNNLIVFRSAAASDPYVYNTEDQTETTLYTSWNQQASQQAPKVLLGRLIIPTIGDQPAFLTSPKDIYMAITNQISTNPL